MRMKQKRKITARAVARALNDESPYNVVLDVKWPRRWRCSRACTRDEGCERCLVYRCVTCKFLRPWDDGGTDHPECDACHAARRARARGLVA